MAGWQLADLLETNDERTRAGLGHMKGGCNLKNQSLERWRRRDHPSEVVDEGIVCRLACFAYLWVVVRQENDFTRKHSQTPIRPPKIEWRKMLGSLPGHSANFLGLPAGRENEVPAHTLQYNT